MTAGAEPDIDEPTKPTAIFKAFGKVPADAVLLLEQDHREVESCFTAYKHLTDETAKQKVRDKICMLLKAHAGRRTNLLSGGTRRHRRRRHG
jgi:hypothetical protein